MAVWTEFVVGIDMPLQACGEVPTARTGVYFLFAGDGGMLYVGKSVNIEYRLSQHVKAGRDFQHFGCVEVPDALVRSVESAYIEALNPCDNQKPESSMADWHKDMVAAIRERWKLVVRRKARL